MAKPFIYRCPVTGLNVQGMTTDHEHPESGAGAERRELVHCPACGGTHLVDPAHGPKPLQDPN